MVEKFYLMLPFYEFEFLQLQIPIISYNLDTKATTYENVIIFSLVNKYASSLLHPFNFKFTIFKVLIVWTNYNYKIGRAHV